MLVFEWDDAKEQRNRLKHGISFEEAKPVFSDFDRIELVDDRVDYGEERIIAIGSADAHVLSVVYVLRAGVIRMISARRASREERDAYFDSKNADG